MARASDHNRLLADIMTACHPRMSAPLTLLATRNTFPVWQHPDSREVIVSLRSLPKI